MKAILDALDAKLHSDQSAGGFHAAMGGRIFHGRAPQDQVMQQDTGAVFPHCVYSMSAADESRSFGTAVTHEPSFQFDIYAQLDDTQWSSYEALLYSLLQGPTLSPQGYDRGVVLFSTRGLTSIEEDAIHIISEATIRGTDF